LSDSVERDEPPELKVAAHVLIQLGSELVTDAEQAILECVKNAYDADAPDCFIKIDTNERDTLVERAPAAKLRPFVHPSESVEVSLVEQPEARDAEGRHKPLPDEAGLLEAERRLTYTGRITIEDGGVGISPQEVRTSWLVISNSKKRPGDGRPKKKTSDFGRTPLGDKGLGRLGTMKLGDILYVESAQSEDGPLASAHFRWADCEAAETIDRIPVVAELRNNENAFKGTKVSVLGLSEIKEWRRANRLEELVGSLAQLVSPFESAATFEVEVELDGVRQSLSKMTEELLNKAIARFDFEWKSDPSGKGGELLSTARFKKRLFSARQGKTRQKADVSFTPDDGVGFERFLKEYGRMGRYDPFAFDREDSWFLTLRARQPWSSIVLRDKGPTADDPGSFRGSFYYFSLDRAGDMDLDTEAVLLTDRPMIKRMAGVTILRDGFRVRSQGDWLELAAGMTSGSTYQLRVNNTVGYFALTGEHNPGLTEKSDREGFVENAAYRGFFKIAVACKKFADDALIGVRRAFDDYHKTREEREGSRAALDADGSLAIVDHSQRRMSEAKDDIKKGVEAIDDIVRSISKEVSLDGNARSQLLRATQQAKSALGDVQVKLDPAPAMDEAVRRLKKELEDHRGQTEMLFESAAIGLSARGLAHELRTHLGEIRSRAVALEKSGKSGADFLPNLRAIRAACTEIQKAAALIDPMMPRGRTLKETFALGDFVRKFVELRATYYSRYDIVLTAKADAKAPKVKMSTARLTQVIDNLVRNSAYWLRHGVVEGPGHDLTIGIDVTSTGLVVWDSGPGVDTAYESSLFEIFVTAKPDRDDGQGLGLFIVSNLLRAEGCDIELLPDRNVHGRRYRFAINLSSVVEGNR